MGKNVEFIGKNFVIPFMVAAFSALIGIYSSYALQSHDVNMTFLQFNDTEHNAKVYVILQNAGTGQVKDLELVFNYPFKYQLTGYNSTESAPKVIDSSDGVLRLTIDRLSPRSYMIFNLQSNSPEVLTHSIWLTSNDFTKTFVIPASKTNFAITTIPALAPEALPLGIEALVGIGLIIIFRYALRASSESLRRNYLGVYEIKITKFDSTRIFYGFIIVGIFLFVSYELAAILEHTPTYVVDQPFTVVNNLKPDQFIQLPSQSNSSSNPGGVSFLLLLIGIGVALVYTLRGIKIPSFIWLLKPGKTSTIKLSSIRSSFYEAREVTLEEEIQEGWKEDFYVVKEGKEIVALMAETELGDKKGRKKIQSILTDEDLPPPKWYNDKKFRDNFLLVQDDPMLGELKERMEQNIKKYAVVVAPNQELLGIIGYDAVFKKDS